MATGSELKQITEARLKSAETLMYAKDWHGAGYMLGYTLECALKAVTCKTLNLVTYPENHKNDKINSYFMTHRFEQLLIVSGLENIFSSRGTKEAWQNWSDFTLEYPGEWPSMRYDINTVWDEAKVKRLYQCLVKPRSGILKIIRRNKKW